jgi:hypothetical protein
MVLGPQVRAKQASNEAQQSKVKHYVTDTYAQSKDLTKTHSMFRMVVFGSVSRVPFSQEGFSQ